MSYGTTGTVINTQRMLVSRVSTEVQLAVDVKFKSNRTTDRLNTRAGAIDTYRWVVEQAEFTAALTEDLLTVLQTDAAIGAQSNKTYNNWVLNGVDLSNAAQTNDTYSAALIDYEELAPENGVVMVRVVLRVAAGAL